MKFSYLINDDNQLLIKPTEAKDAVVAKGRLTVDKDNRLIYLLDERPQWRKSYGLPAKIIFKGKWRLNENHDLEMVLDGSSKQFEKDILTIKSSIISVDKNNLVFEVKSYDVEGFLHAQIIKLSGVWFADENNRLSLKVQKRIPDTLTLEGNWQINANQQITYIYQKIELKTKEKIAQTLFFEGFWQFSSANQLAYILKAGSESRFEFRAQIESPNIYPEEGLIKYRLGLGVKRDSPKEEKVIFLYGDWKINRDLSLNFQIEHGNGLISQMQFAAQVSFGKHEVIFALKDKRGEPLNISVTFTYSFLKATDTQAFLRLKAGAKEAGFDIGMRIPF
ncbi:MAG: hypothetical protein V1650_02135 [Candidatus Omnitrophota bacterium]